MSNTMTPGRGAPEKVAVGKADEVTLDGRATISVEEAAKLKVNAQMERLADAGESVASGNLRSLRKCLQYVNDAAEKAGVGFARAPRAIDAVAVLSADRDSFVTVGRVEKDDLQRLPRGTVVITRNPRGGAGHAQIMTGDGKAVSDFEQNSLSVYAGATEFWAFIPKGGGLRLSEEGAAALARGDVGPGSAYRHDVARMLGSSVRWDSVRQDDEDPRRQTDDRRAAEGSPHAPLPDEFSVDKVRQRRGRRAPTEGAGS